MRSDIIRETSSLKESINFYLDFYLRCFDKEKDDVELLRFGVETLKDVKQLTNGHQRFLKGLLKFQSKKRKPVETISIRSAIVGNFDEKDIKVG
ncbi:MAG: hypothetical protein ACTSPO_15620 [Candidatus Heimdallarchaeaceae archaeon]